MGSSLRLLVLLTAGVLGLCATAASVEPVSGHVPRASAAIKQSALAVEGANEPRTLPEGAIARIGSFRFNHPGGITCLRFMPGGKELASVGYDGTVRFWNAKTGKQLKVLGKPREVQPPNRPEPRGAESFPQMEVSRDGKVLATISPYHGLARIWNVESGEEVAAVGLRATGIGYGFALNPDGSMMAISDSTGKVHLWDLTGKGGDLRRRRVFDAIDLAAVGMPTAIAYSGDGKSLITGASDLMVKLWTNLDKEPTHVQLGVHRDTVLAVAISEDGRRVVSGGMDSAIRVWDIVGKKLLQQFDFTEASNQTARRARGQKPALVQISADGKIVCGCAHTGEVKVWDVESGKLLGTYTLRPSPEQTGQHLGALSSDGKLVALASSSGQIEVHELQAGKSISSDGPVGVRVISVSPDGQVVAAGLADGSVGLWELVTGRSIHLLRGHIGAVGYLHFSGDGRHLFSACLDGDDRAITVWDVTTGKEIKSFAGVTHFRHGAGNFMAISADGKLIATGNLGDPLLVRDIASGKVILKPAVRAEFGVFAEGDKELLVLGFDNRGGKAFTRISLADGRAEPVEPAKAPPQGQSALGPILCYGASPDGRYYLVSGIDGAPGGATRKIYDSETGVDTALSCDRAPAPVRLVGGFYVNNFAFAFSRDDWLVAGPGPDNSVCVWEVNTGTERQRFPGHLGDIVSVAFTPDCTKLVTAGMDNTILVWDLGHAGEAHPNLNGDRLWEALASQDSAKARPAMRQLHATPQDAVKLISERLTAPKAIDEKKIEQCIRDLDSDVFAARKAAATALEALGEAAVPYLKKALKDQPSLDLKARLEELLKAIEVGKLTPDQIRAARCVEVLERLNTSEAKDYLAKMSQWPEKDPMTKWARGALRRLDRKPR